MANDTHVGAVYEYGRLAIRAAMTINGGACVALLAFAGSGDPAAKAAAGALMWFAWGVLLAALGACFAYGSQHEYIRIGDTDDAALGIGFWRRGRTLQWCAVGSIMISLGVFMAGAYRAQEEIGAVQLADAADAASPRR